MTPKPTSAVAAREFADKLLNELDDIARDEDVHDYGLPMYEGPLEKMRAVVLAALAAQPAAPAVLAEPEKRIAAIMALVDEFAIARAHATTLCFDQHAIRYRDDVRREVERSIGLFASQARSPLTEWVSVDERLPEEGVPVVVTKDGGIDSFEIDIMEEGCWREWLDYVEHVEVIGGRTSDVKLYTHWAPIPSGIGSATTEAKSHE